MPRKKTPAPRKVQPQSPAIKKEVKCIGLAASGVLIFVGVVIPGALGPVGSWLQSLLLGVFGAGAFILPISLIALAVLLFTAQKIRASVIQAGLLAWFALAFLHIINRLVSPPADYLTGFPFLRFVYEQGAILGGGVVGAVLGEILRLFLGNIGTIIILVVGIIILMVLLTGRSFVSFVERNVDKARDYYDERMANREEYSEYDHEYVEVKPMSHATPKKGERLKPLKRRREVKTVEVRASGFLDVNDIEHEAAGIHILADDDDVDEATMQAARKSPLFSKRALTAVDRHRENEANTPPVIRGLAEPEEAPVLTLYEKPAPVSEELLFEDEPDDFNDESDNDGTISDFEEEYNNNYDYHDTEVFSNEDEIGDEASVHQGIKINSAVPLRKVEAPVKSATATNIKAFPTPVNSSTPEISADNVDYGVDFDVDEGLTDEIIIPISKEKPTQPRFAPMPAYENYEMPPISFLAKNDNPYASAETEAQVLQNSITIEEKLKNFRVEAKVTEVSIGPTVTRYDLSPGPGVKVSVIAGLDKDLALALAAQGLRIEAPIPGKSAVGIEVPNAEPQGVFLREILEHDTFQSYPSKLAFAVGKDIAGQPVVTDVARMPHLLIAGATGSGKSVCINTLIASLLYKARPDEVKLLMIDPKVVELSVYNGIPHLLIPVVTDPKKASGALNWAVQEMENRYAAFAETGCRDLKGFNKHMIDKGEQKLPQIVIIIDELADLMMTCKGEVEESICRLAQKARAAGIHLIVATQRPSVDVITGLIKANIPSRLAFAVSSGTDSRTVLDMYGAEKLLGRGDMLFLPVGQNKPIRVQGGFISDSEVEELVSFLKAQAPIEHTVEMIQQITMPGKSKIEGEVDEHFYDAVEFLLAKGKGSTSMLQRQFRIGYNRASRLMEELEMRGIVGPEDGVKPRKVTITREEYREIYGEDH